MKRHLPLIGIFLLFFLVVSGFARAAAPTPSNETHYKTFLKQQPGLPLQLAA